MKQFPDTHRTSLTSHLQTKVREQSKRRAVISAATKKAAEEICQMVRERVFREYKYLIESTDGELPYLLIRKALSPYRPLIEFDPDRAVWFMFGTRSGWIETTSTDRIEQLIDSEVSELHIEFLRSIQHAYRVAASRGLYETAPGVEELIKGFNSHAIHLRHLLDTAKFKKQLVQEAKILFAKPSASTQFNCNSRFLGYRHHPEGPAILDCRTGKLSTDYEQVKKARCTLSIGSIEEEHLNPKDGGTKLPSTDQLELDAVQKVLASAILGTALPNPINTMTVQLSGEGGHRLFQTVSDCLGEYCFTANTRTTVKRIPRSARVVLALDEKLAAQTVRELQSRRKPGTPSPSQPHLPLIVYNSGSDLSTSVILYAAATKKGGRFVHSSVSSEPERSCFWSWLFSAADPTRNLQCAAAQPDSSSHPDQQIHKLLQEFLKKNRYQPKIASRLDEQQTIKLAALSDQFHLYTKDRGYQTLHASQPLIYDELKRQQFSVSRPRGIRQVKVFAAASPQTCSADSPERTNASSRNECDSEPLRASITLAK